MEKEERVNRHFSLAFKKEKVKLLEGKKVTVRQLSRMYEVSETAIYKWLRKYSTLTKSRERIVVEKESEGEKTLWMMRKVAELERLLGQKQVEIEYLSKVLEYGSELTGIDIKKKHKSQS